MRPRRGWATPGMHEKPVQSRAMPMEHAETAGSAGRPGPARPAADRLPIWALGAGLLAGAVAWLVGEATVEAFRPTMVTMDTPVGRMTAAPAQEVMRTDVKNAAL